MRVALRASLWCCVVSVAAAGLGGIGGSVLTVRGGSTEETVLPQEKRWIMDQVKLRMERIVLLSESLAERGLPFAGVTSISDTIIKSSGQTVVCDPSWSCETSTEEDPKTCLIWGDAEPGTKVVRPSENSEWCGLAALNSLRRRDPVKASRLWFDRYRIDMTRFSRDAGPAGQVLGAFLDKRSATRTATVVVSVIALAVLRLPIQLVVVGVVTSPAVWRNYANWSPIAHAPLPLKLVLIRQAYSAVAYYFSLVEKLIIDTLTDLESRLFEATARPDEPDRAEEEDLDDDYST